MLVDTLPDLDYQDLVNWSHPHNRGRVGWWLVTPQWRGGVTVRDIARRNHGVLTNGPQWTGPRGRPGGWGSLAFDGANDFVEVANHASLNPTAITVAAWVRVTGGNNTYRGVFTKAAANTWGPPYATYHLRLEGGSPNANCFSAFINDGGSEANYVRGSIVRSPGGPWIRVVLTFNGQLLLLYTDGALENSKSLATSLNSSTQNLFIGCRQGPGEHWLGDLDDITVCNRAWSAAEVREDYSQSRRSYPDLLNRYRPVAYSVPAGAPPVGLPFRPLRSGVLRSRLIRRAG